MNALAFSIAYRAAHNLPTHQPRRPRFDRALLQRVADHYDAMPDTCAPEDYVTTFRAYSALQDEILRQYTFLVSVGFTFRFVDHEPYPSFLDMMADIKRNHLDVNATIGEPNAMMVSVNPLFRAVHDVFGHGVTGSDFSAEGEDFTYHAHALAFSPAALPALAMETRGQSAWLNFGPLSQLHRPFPTQKLGTLPTDLARFTY